MDPNRCSDDLPEGREALATAVDRLALQNLDRLPDTTRAHWLLGLRWLLDRLEGQWLGELAGVDACGAAGADHGTQAAATASWLGTQLRMSAAAATSAVRTARALFCGPSPSTAISGAGCGRPDRGRHGRPPRPPDPEAGQTLLAALEPLAHPSDAADERSGDQRRADALVELARPSDAEAGLLPSPAGSAPAECGRRPAQPPRSGHPGRGGRLGRATGA